MDEQPVERRLGGIAQATRLDNLADTIAPASVDSETTHTLPRLRADLKLQAMQVDQAGAPHWVLEDKARNRYFKLGWMQFEMVSRWSCNDAVALLADVNRETTLNVRSSDLQELLQMLENCQLLEVSSKEQLNRMNAELGRKQQSFWKQAFRLSMYARQPLVNPDKALQWLNRFLSPVFDHRRLTFFVLGLAACLGLFGALGHSYEFRNSFSLFMTPSGLALFALTLVVTNVLHEVGHGIVATRFGCRVREMGVALIFMLPVAYCDTSDAWRLAARRKRLLIAAGGIFAELTLAILALLLWIFLPDGVLRTLAFFTAVTSVATTLAINLNPCLKFDGYYLLSDYLGIDNLQQQSFAVARWRVREFFLREDLAPPIPVTARTKKILCRYAFLTWLYRLVLYMTIAVMVYQLWFKALGITLMCAVIATLLIKPIAVELLEYCKAVKTSTFKLRQLLLPTIILLLVAVVAFPLPRKVSAPAVISAKAATQIFSPQPAKIKQINLQVGRRVSRGDVLVMLEDPELEYRHAAVQRELQLLELNNARQSGWLQRSSFQEITPGQIESKKAELNQLSEGIARLSLSAPFDATVVSFPDWLKPQVWIAGNTVLAELATLDEPEVRSYVPASLSKYIRDDDGPQARFYFDAGGDPLSLEFQSLSSGHIDHLVDPILAVQQGGTIATRALEDGALVPLQGWQLGVFTPLETGRQFSNELIGYVLYDAQPRSFARSFFDRMYGVVLRESGF